MVAFLCFYLRGKGQVPSDLPDLVQISEQPGVQLKLTFIGLNSLAAEAVAAVICIRGLILDVAQ